MAENIRISKTIKDSIQLFKSTNYESGYISNQKDSTILQMICLEWASGVYSKNELDHYFDKGFSIVFKGICDNPYCPLCNEALDDKKGVDKDCPYCNVKLDWSSWHKVNDK